MHFECAYFSFFLFHLALKWKNTFLLSRSSLDNHIRFQSCVQWRIQGEGPRRIVYHFLTGWFFLLKRALYFATKLNFRAIEKCKFWGVSSYDLFPSARKAVFPAPTATGVPLRNTLSSLLSRLVDNYGDNSADNQRLDLLAPPLA